MKLVKPGRLIQANLTWMTLPGFHPDGVAIQLVILLDSNMAGEIFNGDNFAKGGLIGKSI